MGLNNQEKDALSISRFRDKVIETLSVEDHTDYVLAKLLQSVLQRLEVSIQSDRIYSRTKFDILTAFWDARDEFHSRNGKV
jgi:hypothetical protein